MTSVLYQNSEILPESKKKGGRTPLDLSSNCFYPLFLTWSLNHAIDYFVLMEQCLIWGGCSPDTIGFFLRFLGLRLYHSLSQGFLVLRITEYMFLSLCNLSVWETKTQNVIKLSKSSRTFKSLCLSDTIHGAIDSSFQDDKAQGPNNPPPHFTEKKQVHTERKIHHSKPQQQERRLQLAGARWTTETMLFTTA